MKRQELTLIQPPERETATVRAPIRGLSAERSRVWLRRATLIGCVALGLLPVLALMGLPTLWLPPVVSFIGAELFRRIAAEGNPGVPMRWRDILGFAWRVSRGQPPVPEFCGPPRPSPDQRRAQLRLVASNQQHQED